MPRINLLPWREVLRQKRKKDFLAAIVGAVLLGGGAIYASKWIVQQRIENQEARNGILEEEIRQLDAQIEEIRGLENQKERLVARMRIIEELQQSRPLVVHLFDELVEALPEGTNYSRVEQTGERVALTGIASSTTRVASLMRNIEASDWLSTPELGSIEAINSSAGRASEFAVSARQVSTLQMEQDEQLEQVEDVE
ncbi:MAG TPA: PilN domain-containing protein [Gammaproteobacteria bacterium]|nr:PilN domain-containing protein [Gammaproteobacteria bacterium]